jgi:ABC-type transport system involved in cytochrome c biogenesis ATPase subunit
MDLLLPLMTAVEVKNLFGYVNHTVNVRVDSPTVLTAPNGAGKTHILTLISATMSLDMKVLLETIYEEFIVRFIDGRSIHVTRTVDDESIVNVKLQVFQGRRKLGKPLFYNHDMLEAASQNLPSFIKQLGPDRWIDRRSGRTYNRSTLERRFRTRVGNISLESRQAASEVMALCIEPHPVMIDTKRLDMAVIESMDRDYSSINSSSLSGAAARIEEYTAQLRREMTEARQNSIQATQSTDLSFAARALAAANERVRESDLHERYDRTVERYETLALNSLAVGEAPLAFPEQTTPTVRRILHVFLSDWETRLEPLLPLNDKIQTLREILDSKLEPSGKKTTMSPRQGLGFRSVTGSRISVANLSSGEQHLVALFTLLLFSAQPGSVVLIDEPEISLHAAWKHKFLEDIARVAAISRLQIIMATHSSAIINGRWDLTEELTFTLPIAPADASAEQADNMIPETDEADFDDE